MQQQAAVGDVSTESLIGGTLNVDVNFQQLDCKSDNWWVVAIGTSREKQQTFGLVVVQHSSIPLQECHHLAVFVPDSIHDRGAIVPATSDAIAA